MANPMHSAAKHRLQWYCRSIAASVGFCSERQYEYWFVTNNITKRGCHVLDVGGADSLLALKLARKGHRVTVIDPRGYGENHPNIKPIVGDAMDMGFADGTFDYVVSVSTFEHVGIGHYGDTISEDGDLMAMKECKRVVKENGKIILSFPFFGRMFEVPGYERWYDPVRARALVGDWHVHRADYIAPLGRFLTRPVWQRVERSVAESWIDQAKYHTTALLVIARSPRGEWD